MEWLWNDPESIPGTLSATRLNVTPDGMPVQPFSFYLQKHFNLIYMHSTWAAQIGWCVSSRVLFFFFLSPIWSLLLVACMPLSPELQTDQWASMRKSPDVQGLISPCSDWPSFWGLEVPRQTSWFLGGLHSRLNGFKAWNLPPSCSSPSEVCAINFLCEYSQAVPPVFRRNHTCGIYLGLDEGIGWEGREWS